MDRPLISGIYQAINSVNKDFSARQAQQYTAENSYYGQPTNFAEGLQAADKNTEKININDLHTATFQQQQARPEHFYSPTGMNEDNAEKSTGEKEEEEAAEGEGDKEDEHIDAEDM